MLGTLFVGAEAQGQDTLSFVPQWRGQVLQLDTAYQMAEDSAVVRIQRLRFYVGQVQLLQDDQVVFSLPESYYLIDAAVPNSQQLGWQLPEGVAYNRLRFLVGVDSSMNAAGVQGGALDPMYGMYWT